MSNTYSFLAENLLLPFYDFARGTCRFKCSRVLDKTQWLPSKEIQRIQIHNLRALLTYAYETVPYYRRIFKERKLFPRDIRCMDDLVKLPVLTKADIRRHYWDLVSRCFPRNKLVSSVSGGTGDQIRFFVTKEQQSWELAAEFRAYGWAGYRFGDKCVIFWGSPVDLKKYEGVVKRFTSFFERVFVLNTYVLSDDVLERFIHIMRKVRPAVVRGYASSVYLIAKYMLKNGCDDIRPRVVLTSAESLMDFQRKTIEEAFGCKVFDYYGSREVGAIAAECERHSGYHVSAENTLLEFVRDEEHVSAGESGEILVTSLRNFGMPFIRYAIGDVGKPSNELCRCGRGLPLMSSIEGRVSQFMAVYDKQLGRIIPVSTAAPGPFSLVLMQVPIESYRIIQESLDRVVIVAVKGKDYRQEHSDFIVANMKKLFGDNVKINFEFVGSLPPLPSGKRSIFISKINSFV